MATSHRHDTATPLFIERDLLLGVLEAADALTARHRPLTPENVARWFHQHHLSMPVSPEAITYGVTTLHQWQADPLLCEVLAERRQLAQCARELEKQQKELAKEQAYLTMMIQEADLQLEREWREVSRLASQSIQHTLQ